MSAPIRLTCFECMSSFTVPSNTAGGRTTCPKDGCGANLLVPADSRPIVRQPRGKTFDDKPPTKKGGDIPTGAVGLVLAVAFCVWIAITPGGLYAVFIGGTIGFAGLVISIFGIAKGSGRVLGVFGILAFILGWTINTLVVGRL